MSGLANEVLMGSWGGCPSAPTLYLLLPIPWGHAAATATTSGAGRKTPGSWTASPSHCPPLDCLPRGFFPCEANKPRRFARVLSVTLDVWAGSFFAPQGCRVYRSILGVHPRHARSTSSLLQVMTSRHEVSNVSWEIKPALFPTAGLSCS